MAFFHFSGLCLFWNCLWQIWPFKFFWTWQTCFEWLLSCFFFFVPYLSQQLYFIFKCFSRATKELIKNLRKRHFCIFVALYLDQTTMCATCVFFGKNFRKKLIKKHVFSLNRFQVLFIFIFSIFLVMLDLRSKNMKNFKSMIRIKSKISNNDNSCKSLYNLRS